MWETPKQENLDATNEKLGLSLIRGVLVRKVSARRHKSYYRLGKVALGLDQLEGFFFFFFF